MLSWGSGTGSDQPEKPGVWGNWIAKRFSGRFFKINLKWKISRDDHFGGSVVPWFLILLVCSTVDKRKICGILQITTAASEVL